MSYSSATNPVNLPSTTTPGQLESALDNYGMRLAVDYAPDGKFRPVPGVGWMLHDAAQAWSRHGYTVNVDVLAGQIIKEAAALQSAISRDKNNPSGLGAENDDPYRKANSFHAMYYGILATTAHLLNYFVGYGPWSVVDPRTDVMRSAGYLGIAKRLSDLDGRWAVPGIGYGASVATLANAVTVYKAKEKIMPNPVIQADNIYGTPFRVSLIPWDNPNRTREIVIDPSLPPVIHETANFNDGADAEAHRIFTHDQKGGAENVSFQFVVDDHEIIQLLPLYEKGVHAGNGECNRRRAGIEMCVNRDGDFNATMANAAKLVRFLGEYDANMAGLPIQHHGCSGKNCPALLRQGRWEEFLKMVDQTDVPLPADPNAERFVWDGGEFWIVNTTSDDGHRVNMLDFYREMGGLPRLGYPVEGLHRRDTNEPPVYLQQTENVLMECWVTGFGNIPGPYFRFGRTV